jgi:peptidyl-Asp metalloendopeptidase
MVNIDGPRAVAPRISAAALLALCVAVSPLLAQTAGERVGLTPDQQAIVDKITKSTHGENVQFNGAPTGPVGAIIKLPFRDGKSLTLVRKGSSVQRNGSISWRGEVEETGERAHLMLWGNAMLTGHFAYKGTIYTIENVGGGINAFAEMDRRKLPADHPSPATRDIDPLPVTKQLKTLPPGPEVAPFADATRLALEAKNVTIDVMILYTGNVAKHYVRDPSDLLALGIEEANETFRNSGLGNIKLRLVHTQQLDYDGSSGDQFSHLYRMVDGDGIFKDVKRLRNEKRADIVGLIIDNPNGCGLSTRIGADSDEAFFVVHHACALITMSIPHEIGHILGARHDRFVDNSDSYGHGYVNGTKWRDLMSYNAGCGGCPRLPFWSNPRVMYKGEPTGTPAADNARLILELAERVADFR